VAVHLRASMNVLTLVVLAGCAGSADPAKSIDPQTEPPPMASSSASPMASTTPTTAPAAPTAPAANEAPEIRVKRIVDRYRAAAGLPAVALDAKLSKGCMEHAEYMRLNKDSEAMAGLNAHNQRPSLPGATPDGAACGKAANLFPGVADLEASVDGWMASLYHRRPILAPPLARIGFGYSKLADGSYMAALMFVDGNDPAAEARWPVAYPADKQTGIPLEFGNEVPNPVPGGGRAGYPITIQFPPFDKVTKVTARLADAAGKPVAFYLSDPEHPATSFPQQGVVCLIPKVPLAASTRYDVEVAGTWKSKAGKWSWSFTTLALKAVDAHDEAAVVRALNIPSTLRGTVLHGGMMDSNTAFLQIGERELKNYKMISVLIPRAVWQKLGGSPGVFVGKKIEVDGTPHVAQGAYINVTITVAGQLRIVP
jgi:uncharacterized protein YkwD